MTRLPITRVGIERDLFLKEFEIRGVLKTVNPTNTFSVDGAAKTQRSNIALLRSCGLNVADTAFQPDWNNLGSRQASAACIYEQFWARIWGLGVLRESLNADYRTLRFLTFVDTSDRRAAGQLHRFNLSTYKRRMTRALAGLKRRNPHVWAFGSVEISASREDDGALLFEPHCHLMVGNASADELHTVFRAALKQGSAAPRPVKLQAVSSRADMVRLLGYILKQVPEFRTRVLGGNGRAIQGRTNLLRGVSKAEWLAWMSQYHTEEMLIATGAPANAMRLFAQRDLQSIMREFLRQHDQ
jgi:hypothetical protein